MISVVATERFYRCLLLQERLNQIASEIAALSDPLLIEESEEFRHLDRAEWGVRLALDSLKKAQAEARSHCQQSLLEEQMKASIELIGESPERMRRDANGETA